MPEVQGPYGAVRLVLFVSFICGMFKDDVSQMWPIGREMLG
jgi:hypothetical protein